MTIVAENYAYVIGVDTHARTHTYAITDTRTGACCGCESFPVTTAGIKRAIAWIRRNTSGPVLAAVEGTCSYGASLTRALTGENLPVVEAKPLRKKARGGAGKTDAIDAIAAASSVLGTELEHLINPRTEGTRAGISILLASRRRLEGQTTANRNALNALVRQVDLGLDTRAPLSDKTITEISSWRPRPTDTIEQQIGREEAIDLARTITTADGKLKANKAQLHQLCEELAPGLQDQTGVGPVTGSTIVAAYSHHGRIRNEAAFATVAGVSPIPASSGNTTRHRLNRTGDRQLNMALDVTARTRMRCDKRTKEYVERRTQEGRTYREIKRALKRYIARSIYRQLQTIFA